jgi:hypothetical protein
VRRAGLRLGENSYRLLTNNCEHFCDWCIRGQPRSHQVEEFISRWRLLRRIEKLWGLIERPLGELNSPKMITDDS